MQVSGDSPKRVKATFSLPVELIEIARDAAAAANIPLALAVEDGLVLALDRLRDRLGVVAFPRRSGPLPVGQSARRDMRRPVESGGEAAMT